MSHPTPSNALIGCSGFVGSTLERQTAFAARYRSSNIGQLDGRSFDLVVCAAAPAKKWLANIDPAADREGIERLMSHLRKVDAKQFVLISTVDVFGDPVGVDEESRVNEEKLHPYGLHRRLLESFVQERFSNHLVVRLPGLVGPGLRKNVVFDLLNENNLDAIDSRSSFQFYPMINLWYDLQLALEHRLALVHLTAEPLTVEQVATLGFNRPFQHVLPTAPACYDVQTRHAALFGGKARHQYSVRESLQAIRAYAQSELRNGSSAGEKTT